LSLKKVDKENWNQMENEKKKDPAPICSKRKSTGKNGQGDDQNTTGNPKKLRETAIAVVNQHLCEGKLGPGKKRCVGNCKSGHHLTGK
jgi:hypothetical protein